MKKYTHAKGFNVTSLEGVAGVYIFQENCYDIAYVGQCDDDFKNRLGSHTNKTNGKLDLDIRYIHVVIADTILYPLHVLEHLFIWYFRPPRNESLWFFGGAKSEKEVQRIAQKHNLHIRGSLLEFILSFECVLLERELEDDFTFKRYGEIEVLSSKKAQCDGTLYCLCYSCLVNRRMEERWGKY